MRGHVRKGYDRAAPLASLLSAPAAKKRLHRDEAAVLRWQRSRRGSRPREWHVRPESRPTTLAAPRLPPPRVGKGIATGTLPPHAPVACACRDDVRGPGAPASQRSRVMHAHPIVTIPIVVRSFFLFRPQPAHHATARCIGRAAHLARPRRDLGCVNARPPRGVTVFAEQCGETGAAQPQKRRRHCTPSHACRFALRGCTFPPPARRHVACSGRRSCGAACSAGNRRAGALAHRPR